ncbi:hypothetical protein IMG5_063030 [Ichthyophthirius multifiliis]|uniref:SF4 helicase domain-containing protein n=1 Tax=Ichthyophthirius multifiliis TaxID=5932 RepID=G0QP05_ICHMU|nr:hypothetical protein IMG5_063030 [Ichthyophthirius multifiliis]EGR33048.1 hypothetical protein IMG5_063030 [Ichthyophthirius multifiliis]|eukprot:XP_004037034.1 hypothetical protein IMG5_063030 [Ichthyophthirius multifiliis]
MVHLIALDVQQKVHVKCKIRGVGKENKQFMRMKPSGQSSGLFGLNTVPINAKEIVITEGEYDAMAVFQETGIPSISLPNGACNLPCQVINCLEQFEKIYLWMDNDQAGQNNYPKIAEKLGLNRSFIVLTKNGEKDANDVLRKNPHKMIQYIKEARTIHDKNILKFEDIKEQVYNRIFKFDLNQGVKCSSFQFYNEKIKGLRKGEMTVLTGPTGSGKTTFLSQLSLDFCSKQVPTLWGSFEIKNEILATNMVLQYSNENLFKSPEKFIYWSEQFQNIPMYFMSFFGSTNINNILETIEYSIYAYNIQHVIIDNLQFLLGTQGKGFDKFDLQDKAIENFRKLATEKNIHLTLVIHPKKVDDREDLNISSVFGSAKATQEADQEEKYNQEKETNNKKGGSNNNGGDNNNESGQFIQQCKQIQNRL